MAGEARPAWYAARRPLMEDQGSMHRIQAFFATHPYPPPCRELLTQLRSTCKASFPCISLSPDVPTRRLVAGDEALIKHGQPELLGGVGVQITRIVSIQSMQQRTLP